MGYASIRILNSKKLRIWYKNQPHVSTFCGLRFFCDPSKEALPKITSLYKLPYTIVGSQSFTGSSSSHFGFLLPGFQVELWVTELPKCSFLHSLAIWWCLRALKLPLSPAFSPQFHKTNNVIKSKLSAICLQVASLQSCPTSLNTQAGEASGQRRRAAGSLEPAYWSPFAAMSLPRHLSKPHFTSIYFTDAKARISNEIHSRLPWGLTSQSWGSPQTLSYNRKTRMWSGLQTKQHPAKLVLQIKNTCCLVTAMTGIIHRAHLQEK